MHTGRFIIDCLFFIVAIESFIALFFIKKKTGRIFLLNCLALIAVLHPWYLFYEGTVFSSIEIAAAAGTAVFPISYALLIGNNIKLKSRISLPSIAIPASASFALSILFPGLRVYLFSCLLILFALYMSYLLLNGIFLSKYTYVMLQTGLMFTMALSLASMYTGSNLYYSAAITVLFALTSLFFALSYYGKISSLALHLKRSEEITRQLVHTNARLKLKTEQLRRVIQEKELELMQMSKHASLAEITAGIAHELTQPITGIKGIAQNMMDDINYDEFDNLQAVSELLKICALVDKSSSIIDHIRNFSRKNGMNMQFIDLNRVVLSAIDLINLQFKKYNIDIVLILDEGIRKVFGDTISLEQLIINLLLNARDAIIERRKSESPEYPGKITIATGHLEDEVRLSIDDNGTGIPQDIIRKIWSPFFTTKRKSNSTGIGLSISRKILKEHNARVNLESTPGTGTTFIVLFPIKRESPVAAG